MQVVKVEEYDNKDRYTKIIWLDKTVQLDSLIPIIRSFENDDIKMLDCLCQTFSESGSQRNIRYNKAEDILNFRNEPSPYATFSITFVDRETLDYKFSLVTGINLKYLEYIINRRRIK